MNYSEAQAYLFQRLPMFQRVGVVAYKADLNNTIKLLDGIGNPQLKFKSVHIAGTNGKGTSAHSIAAILQSAGYKTGLYTSPHLKSFTERVKINGQEISKGEVAKFVTANQSLIESINPSFFEVTVALAFNHFAEKGVDIAIIETGLGGRLDSTNVIDPLISLITMIDFDHAEILGDTLEAIANEKAGIIKPGRPVIIGSDQPDIFYVFQKKANEVKAPLFQSTHFKVVDKGLNDHHRAFEVIGWSGDLSRFSTDIIASYYLKNVPGILGTIKELRNQGFEISENAVTEGLYDVKDLTGLKGRWQIIAEEPLVVADISHNEIGVKVLLDQIRSIKKEKLHIVFGVVRDKAIEKILAQLPSEASYYFTQSSVPRSLPVLDLLAKVEPYQLRGSGFEDVNEAIQSAKMNAQKDDLIIIFGSTFVVAEIEGL